MITDRLIEKIIDLQNPTCVGLDTLFDYLPDDMKERFEALICERMAVLAVPQNK